MSTPKPRSPLKLLNAVIITVMAFPAILVQPALAGSIVTERVSISSEGMEGNGVSETPAISADGRWVVFASKADNLVPGDSNGADDIFLHDWATGRTERLSLSSDGVEGNGASTWPDISADGRWVVFSSTASNLVPDDTNGTADIFLVDLQDGGIERISVSASDTQSNGASTQPVISGDGRFVVFASNATNLFSGATSGRQEIFLVDRSDGMLKWVSRPISGSVNDADSSEPAISADGNWVAFSSLSSQLVPNDDEGRWDVFLWSPSGNLIRVSQTPSGDGGNMSSYIPALSADGRYTVFRSHAMNLISGDTNYVADILLYDRLTATLERVNLSENGDQAMGGPSDEPAISADGRYVVFRSRASNLVSNDTTTDEDIFIRDRQGGTTLASVSTDSIKANLGSFSPAVSADGQIFAFYSDGFNLDLLRSDDNGVGDIFARGEPPAPPATETPTATPSETPTETPTDTPTVEPTPTDTPAPTPTDTVEPTPTDSPEPTPTATVKPTDTATPKPSATTPVPTATFTPVPTADPTVEPTVVPTDPPTATSEPNPTKTAEPTTTSDPPGAGQPPVVQLDSSYTLKEGGQLSMSGSFSDPDSDSWTGTVDYGDGSGLQPLTLKNNGGFKLNWTFGDDGEYTVVVNITDESDRTGSAEVQVKVKNQTPSAQAEKSINLAECEQAEKSGKKDKPNKACKIGDWYIATAGQPTDFVIEMNDAGSDDLHIVWDSGSDTVYYNAGSSPDPYPSPWGTYPFSVRHNATVVFDKPGVRYIKVQVSDDDGGTTTIWLKVLVRNKEKCRTSLGYWIQRFMREGDGVYKGELRAHLSVLSAFVTSSFGEFRPDMIDRLESFVLDNTGQSARARAQLITAWLNFTNGSVDWDEWIQKADGKHDMTYADVLREMLTILMNSGSDEDFERVIELAESINLGHHSGGTGCPVYSE